MTDQTQQYCTALLNQERSLEELQRHLRTTEDLFRESVKRKNQQLDLLQSEVRRLKTSVHGRDELSTAQMEAALGAQVSELQTLREQLAARENELDGYSSRVASLEAAVQAAEQKSKQAERRAEAAEAARADATNDTEQTNDALQESLSQAQAVAAAAQEQAALADEEAEALREEMGSLRGELETLQQAGASEAAGRSELDRSQIEQLSAKLSAAEAEAVKERQWREQLEEQLERVEEAASAGGAGQQAAAHAAQREVEALKEALATQMEATEAAQRGRAEAEHLAEQLEVELAQSLDSSSSAAAAAGAAGAATARGRGGSGRGGGGGGGQQPTTTVSAAAPPPAAPGHAPLPSPTSGEADVRELSLVGEATMGGTLIAQPALGGAADAAATRFEWFRGGVPVPHAAGPQYTLGAEDVGKEVAVRVTAVGADGSVGGQKSAQSARATLSAEVHRKLAEWVQSGEKRFGEGIAEEGSDKERVLLFARDKLKLQDKAKKTLCKDAYGAVELKLPAGESDDGRSLHLAMASLHKKGGGVTLRVAQRGIRDLIYLTLQVYADPASYAALPVAHAAAAPPGTPGAAGGLQQLQIAPGSSAGPSGPPSPTSSACSEQPSVSDVSDAIAASARKQSIGAKLGGRRTLSFGRKAKTPG